MSQVTYNLTDTYRITSFGNGWAFLIEKLPMWKNSWDECTDADKPDMDSLWLQDEDASIFDAEIDAIENGKYIHLGLMEAINYYVSQYF